MTILVLVLTIILIILAVYFILLKKELKNIRQQITFIQNMDTNKQLITDLQDRDIVELVNQLNQFIQVKKTLELDVQHQNKNLRDMVLNMSHDLRTPLTSIRGYMQMLSLDELPDEKKKQYITIINEKILVLNDLLNNFFELSKVESEDYVLALKLVDIQPILAELLAAVYPDFMARGIDLDVSLDSKLLILGNADALKRIFQNLLDNTLKHEGKQAAIHGCSTDDEVTLQFSSVAPDFDPKRLPMLFDRFYTFSNDNQNKNTGLGLAIVKDLTEKMGGTISADYQGETFRISLRFPEG